MKYILIDTPHSTEFGIDFLECIQKDVFIDSSIHEVGDIVIGCSNQCNPEIFKRKELYVVTDRFFLDDFCLEVVNGEEKIHIVTKDNIEEFKKSPNHYRIMATTNKDLPYQITSEKEFELLLIKINNGERINWEKFLDYNGEIRYFSGKENEFTIYYDETQKYWILSYTDFWTINGSNFVNIKNSSAKEFAVPYLKKYAEEIAKNKINYLENKKIDL